MTADKNGMKFTFEKKEAEPKFKIGDRVMVKDESVGATKGSIFVVGYIQRNHTSGFYPEHDHSLFSYKDKDNAVVKRGFVIPENNLELIGSAHVGKILIMVDENDPDKIIARNLITGEKTETKKHPKDEWDFNKGAEIALGRLLHPEKKEEKSIYWSGKVICVDKKVTTNFFTIGKVYKVIDGYLLDNGNDITKPYTSHIRNPIELLDRLGYYRFIEYKGGAEE